MPGDRQARAVLLAAALPLASLGADPTPPPPSPAAMAPTPAVDAELLEFLGEFDDAKGEFVDPFVIDAASTVVADAEREAKRSAKTDQTTVASPATEAPGATPPEKTP